MHLLKILRMSISRPFSILRAGSMLGTFMLLYCVLTLYGTSLLYNDVESTGCDPSSGVASNDTCQSSGPDVFGAMLGACAKVRKIPIV